MTTTLLRWSGAAVLAIATASFSWQSLAEPAVVYPFAETESVASGDDAADDPAIWVHPEDPLKSLVIGTDKQAGLAVYDLKGKQVSFCPDGEMNNVDLRTDFPLGGKSIVLVGASNRTSDSIALYALDPTSGSLTSVTARPLETGIAVYGFCLYRDSKNGEHYAFINSKRGAVQQWRIFDNGEGTIDAEKVVQFDVGSQVEGMVADDERSLLYVGEEKVAVWRYPLPVDLEEIIRFPVDIKAPLGNVIEDVEGLTLYLTPHVTGYLIASNQGNNEFLVYERTGDNRFLGSFRIAGANGIDGVTETDGIDVTSASLGPEFEGGLLVVQDDEDDQGNQNFKYVRWADVAQALGLD